MKIEVLYPEIANLYGDLENITYTTQQEVVQILQNQPQEERLFLLFYQMVNKI